MKLFIVSNLIVSLLGSKASATFAVQRTPTSSYSDFQKYLAESKKISFSQAYIQIASVTDVESESVENCLEDVYLGKNKTETCFQAIKSLTSKPLNSFRREVLFSFLSKLEKLPGPRQNFYRQLQKGLLWTHPDLAKVFHSIVETKKMEPSNVQALELKAWKRSVVQKFPMEEISILINGKKISHLEKWVAPQGIYQWTLVSNTHEPLMRLGSFTQFASESLIHLKPLIDGDCSSLTEVEFKTYGILQLEIFSSSKCITQFGTVAKGNISESHLGALPTTPSDNPTIRSRSWLLPALAGLAAGIAYGLRGKQVSIQ